MTLEQLSDQLWLEAHYFEVPVTSIRMFHAQNIIEVGIYGRYIQCTAEFVLRVPPHQFWQRFINGKWP